MFLRVTIAVCTLLIAWSTFRSGLPFDLFGLVAWLLYSVIALGSLICCFRKSGDWRPSAICGAGLLYIYIVPLDRLSRYIDFHLHLSTRESIILNIQNGTLRGEERSRGGITGNHFTVNGYDVVELKHNGKRRYFFYVPQGSDGPVGWIYAPDGDDPPPSQTHRINEHWYYRHH